MASGRAIVALTLVVVFAAIGCSAQPAGPPKPPTPPPDWTVVTNDPGDLRLALPPWMVPFETSGAILANEVVAGGSQGVQIMAEGPRTAEPQPDREGIQRWLEQRIQAPDAGVATVAKVRLPAGEAVVIERVDRAGTPLAWRIAAYAITTRQGTAYLVVDGPLDAWTVHEEDIARIPGLVQTRP